MAKDIFYTAIDIGTSKVCTLVAHVEPAGNLKIVGIGVVPSQGMDKGRIVDVAGTQEAVRASVKEAQRYLGNRIPWAYVSVSGAHITCFNTTGIIHPGNEESTISLMDVENLVKNSYPNMDDNKELLHVIPVTYLIDGYRSVRNPVGLHAGRLQVESHIVMGDADLISKTIRAVEDSSIPVQSLVLSSLASSESSLSEDEKEMGVVLADIGAGSTDLAIFKDGSLWYNASIPVGGNQLTRDLSVALGMPYYFAEDLKDKWGHASPNGDQAGEEVLLPSFQGQPRRLIRRTALCKPLVDRLQETLGLILVKIQQAGLNKFPPGGIVLTGGTAEVPGLQQMAKDTLGCQARVASPLGILGLTHEQNKPSFSTAIGLLLWSVKNHGGKKSYSMREFDEEEPKNIFQRIREVVQVK